MRVRLALCFARKKIGVGKTALVNRYVHAAFSPDSVATIGVRALLTVAEV